MMDNHCLFELVDEHYTDESERLARMALKYGLPAYLVEDIVHEVWVHLMEHPPEFATERAARLRAWLRWVLRNKVVDTLRHLGCLRVHSLDALPEGTLPPEEEGTTPGEDEGSEQLAALLEWLEWHDEENARLLRDYYFSGQRAREVAARWGLTLPALYCRISRVVETLRKQAAKLFAAQRGGQLFWKNLKKAREDLGTQTII